MVYSQQIQSFLTLVQFPLLWWQLSHCQTNDEMWKELKTYSLDWPSFHCCNYAWDEDIFNSLQSDAESPPAHLAKGVKGLYKYSQIGKTCNGIMDKAKLNTNTNKRSSCFKACVLHELKILKNGWSEPVAVGNIDEATMKMKDFFSSELKKPRHFLLNLDYVLDRTLGLMFIRAERYLLYIHPKEISCQDDEFLYSQFLNYSINDPMSAECGTWHAGSPDNFIIPISLKEVAAFKFKLWPDLSCLTDFWVDSSKSVSSKSPVVVTRQVNATFRLFEWNEACRKSFTNAGFRKEYGDEAVETCTKLCILNKMEIFIAVPTGEFNALYEDNYYLQGIREGERHIPFAKDVSFTYGKSNEFNLFHDLHLEIVDSKANDMFTYPHTAKCREYKFWSPLFPIIEDFFVIQDTAFGLNSS